MPRREDAEGWGACHGEWAGWCLEHVVKSDLQKHPELAERKRTEQALDTAVRTSIERDLAAQPVPNTAARGSRSGFTPSRSTGLVGLGREVGSYISHMVVVLTESVRRAFGGPASPRPVSSASDGTRGR